MGGGRAPRNLADKLTLFKPWADYAQHIITCPLGFKKQSTALLSATMTRADRHIDASSLDTFQDFLIAEHIKPRMHMLEISILLLKCVVVRPTKTPKTADKKMAQF